MGASMRAMATSFSFPPATPDDELHLVMEGVISLPPGRSRF